MNENHESRPEPGLEEYAKCSTLVAKVIILQNHRYTQDEIDLADYLLGFKWNANVTDFLEVVAGIAHAGLNVDEAYGALVYRYDKQKHK
ncbi:MAG TPA: hypothetical protein VJM08_15875 [Anaerolineales bacterium]|nr:hypothetical protein [Anaerolineales bacterium]